MSLRYLQPMIISWLSMVATDLILHAGILARLYTRESPFILSAEDAFIRIPLGYLSFLLMAVLLSFIFHLKMPDRPLSGFLEGLKIGFIVWLSFGMGLYSISTIDLDLACGWVLGQTLEMGVGGCFLAHALHAQKITGTWKKLGLYAVIVVILTIVLQISGMAPPMKTY